MTVRDGSAMSTPEPPPPEAGAEDAMKKTPEPKRRRMVGFAVAADADDDAAAAQQEEAEEADDSVADLPPGGPMRSRRHTFSVVGATHPPRSIDTLDWQSENLKVVNLANPNALTENRDELEEIPGMFASARRGSLLY